MNQYVRTPNAVHLNDVVGKDYSLSSSQYVSLVMPNTNSKPVSYFLSRPLKRSDLGQEVGSLSYIDHSTKYFIRTKALQAHSYLPDLTSETMLPILPKDFVDMNLKKGDVIISKDSNIGEVVILDKDYPDCMLSGAIYKLPIKEEWKYYLLACIKHPIFREQLDFMVPKGATIRHAKTLFLDCLIPLPNSDSENIIRYVSLLMQAIIRKEELIKQRHATILSLIDDELCNNQKENSFTYHLPTFQDLQSVGRLDTGLYSPEFKKLTHLIQNYKDGYVSFLHLNDNKVNISRGQNLQESNIGKSIYTEKPFPGYYRLCLSKHFTEYQTTTKFEYLGNRLPLKTIRQGDIIFSCRGDMGRAIIFCEPVKNTITNIDNVHIEFDGQPLYKTIFISQFLGYLRNCGYIAKVANTGSGADSFTKYQFDMLPIPSFPDTKQKEIASLYYTANDYDASVCSLDNFLQYDSDYNESAGIYELDHSAKYLREILNTTIHNIVTNQPVNIHF